MGRRKNRLTVRPAKNSIRQPFGLRWWIALLQNSGRSRRSVRILGVEKEAPAAEKDGCSAHI